MKKIILFLLFFLITENSLAQTSQYEKLSVFDTISLQEKISLYDSDPSLCAAMVFMDQFRDELNQLAASQIIQYKDITYDDIKNKLLFGLWKNTDKYTEQWQNQYSQALYDFNMKDKMFRNTKKLQNAFQEKGELNGLELMEILMSENDSQIDLSYYVNHPEEMNENWMFYYTMLNAGYEYMEVVETDLTRQEIDESYKSLNEFILEKLDPHLASLYSILLNMKAQNLKKSFINPLK